MENLDDIIGAVGFSTVIREEVTSFIRFVVFLNPIAQVFLQKLLHRNWSNTV